MAEQRPKTYEELKREREREWEAAQAKAATALAEQQAEMKKMPDVAHPPDPRQPWGDEGVACRACGGEGFKVLRFVTVNGHRHRAEVKCLGCGWIDTFDFGDRRWLRPR
jgi:hypothetical protein